MTRAEKLARLSALASLLADRATAPIRHAQADLDRTQDAFHTVMRHQRLLAPDTSDPVHATLSNAHLANLRREQAVAVSGLANARLAVEQARAQARPAIGRELVLQSLLEKEIQRKPRRSG